MKKNAFFSALVPFALTAALLGCSKPTYNIAAAPRVPVTRFKTPLILRIPRVVDSRPNIEKKGDSANLHVLLPFIPLFFYIENRGSDITGDENFQQAPAAQMHANLLAHFNKSQTFSEVTVEGAAHLELQVELLHFYSHRYRTGWGFGSAGGGTSTSDFFSYNTNVVMKLRLVDLTREGKLIMERVVHGTSSDPPRITQPTVSVLKAVRQSLGETWYWTIAAVREITDTMSEDDYLKLLHEHCAKGKACRFNVMRIGQFHESVDLITIDMDSGNVVNKNRLSNLTTAPPGRAGEWLLSPWDAEGFPLPSNQYNALAKFITRQGFMVRRLDHFSLYHFFGVREK